MVTRVWGHRHCAGGEGGISAFAAFRRMNSPGGSHPMRFKEVFSECLSRALGPLSAAIRAAKPIGIAQVFFRDHEGTGTVLAEREGFEPSVRFPVQLLSRQP